MNVHPFAKADGGRFRILSVVDIPEAITSDYLVKGIIAPGAFSVIYGEPGSAKTFAALHIAYRLSMDRMIFGRRVHAAPVLYVCLEGERGFQRRVAACVQRWGASGCFFYTTERADLFGGLGDTEGIIAAVNEVGAKLVVVDTLARAMGAGSENESADMGRVIAAFDVIRCETGAHVMVIHHSGKDSSRGMRGHSSLLAAADTMFELKRSEAGPRTLRIAKSKDGIDGEEFPFELDVRELGLDDDGDPITSCVIREMEADPNAARKVIRLPPAAKAALDHLNRCLCDLGKPAPPYPQIPGGVTCVTLNEWRDHLLKAGLLNRDGSYREQFKRVRVTLQNARAIGVWDEHVWRVT
jgi:hypothetical protein